MQFSTIRAAMTAALVAAAGVQALPQQATEDWAQGTQVQSWAEATQVQTTEAAVASASAAASSTSPTTSSSSSSSSGTACNNSPDLCDRQYNKITHMGAHDSSFLRDSSTGNSVAGNQYQNATKALDAGLRLLQAQVHVENSTLELCHTTCDLLDAGPLDEWLSAINDWMSANPNEVITILLVNSDDAEASEFGDAFTSSGLADIAYEPATTDRTTDWPTLQEMIDSKKRVVVFVTSVSADTEHPYIMSEFKYVFETAYEVFELTGFNCTLDRPSKQNDSASALDNGFLSLVNHFKYNSLGSDLMVTDVNNIETVNSASTSEDGNLGKHLAQCKDEWSGVPNFVLVDFFNKGDVMEAADTMNDISDATGRQVSDTDDDESKAVGKERTFGTGALIAFVAAALLLV